MLTFEYENPVKVYFGQGELARLGEIIGGRYKAVLVACAKGPLMENGSYQKVLDLIKGANVSV